MYRYANYRDVFHHFTKAKEAQEGGVDQRRRVIIKEAGVTTLVRAKECHSWTDWVRFHVKLTMITTFTPI